MVCDPRPRDLSQRRSEDRRLQPTPWSITTLTVSRRERVRQVMICSRAGTVSAAIRRGSMSAEADMSSHTMGYDAPSGVGINWRSADFLPRDREQSRLLHEPPWLVTNSDPMTGRDIDASLADRPHIVDQRLTLYFESEQTRQAYLDLSGRRSLPLPDNPYDDGEAEG